jgi:hypothetical protein
MPPAAPSALRGGESTFAIGPFRGFLGPTVATVNISGSAGCGEPLAHWGNPIWTRLDGGTIEIRKP